MVKDKKYEELVHITSDKTVSFKKDMKQLTLTTVYAEVQQSVQVALLHI